MPQELETFDKRATAVKKAVTENNGIAPEQGKDVAGMSSLSIKTNILEDMQAAVKQMDAMRAGTKDRKAVDIKFEDFVKDKWGFGSMDSFYNAIDLNPSMHSVENLYSLPEFPGYRWIVPEIIRAAIRTGLRKNPIYASLIAAEETVTQPTVFMPNINMSDATPKKVNEAETIPTGTVSFNQKSVKIHKVGIGLKITDEVAQYSSLNILAIYLQDVGIKLGLALDNLAVDILINGDQDGGTESAPVIGTISGTSFTYKDILRAWIRMGMIGRLPQVMLSNEDPALDILDLAEFKASGNAAPAAKKIDVRTPIPQSQDYFINGNMLDTDQLMLIDTTAALLKLNAQALKVESERMVDKQVNGTYVSLTTGFANLFRDARLIVDRSLAYSGNGFPSWMTPGNFERENFNRVY